MSWRIIIAAGLGGLGACASPPGMDGAAWPVPAPSACRSILAGACPAIRLSRRCRYSTTVAKPGCISLQRPGCRPSWAWTKRASARCPIRAARLRGAARRLARTALPGRRPEGHGAAQSGAGRQRPGGTPLPPTLYIIKDSPKFRVVHDEILRDSPAVPAILQVKGHTIVPSSSLVPGNDRPCSSPTRAWSSSRMCSRARRRSYSRATSSQRSVRAGGKHNDLENVGYTARHHTFFEMLGNFSFGDYFKRDAISYAWELLTQVYKLPAEKLWVTVYQEDDRPTTSGPRKSACRPSGSSASATTRARYASDNFWQMADTGPCGPCSEIFYDTARTCGAARDRPGKTATATSRSGTWCSCSSSATPPATCRACRVPVSIPAWAWNASPPCCRACTPTMKSTCSSA